MYVAKLERKGRAEAELREVMRWLTGLDDTEIDREIASESTFAEFFATVTLNDNASLITGSICGVKVQDIEDPIEQRVRYLDKLVDELAKGRAMEKVLRS